MAESSLIFAASQRQKTAGGSLQPGRQTLGLRAFTLRDKAGRSSPFFSTGHGCPDGSLSDLGQVQSGLSGVGDEGGRERDLNGSPPLVGGD